jgi:hypothetical protein
MPHGLSDEQTADKVKPSQSRLDMMQKLGPKQQKYRLSGDEPWIYWDNRPRGT